jgi:hypothetical protein
MIPTLALPEILKSFCLQDVTDDPRKLSAAFDIVVDGYSGLSSRRLDPREVRETVCNDDYHRRGLARTLLLSGWNPETSRVEALGTFRMTLGSTDTERFGLRPLEAMNLMTLPEGWANFRFEGFEVNQVVEGGRTAISMACRTGAGRAMGLPGFVLRALAVGGFRLATQKYGKSQLWAILPTYMISRLKAVGIKVIVAPQVVLQLQRQPQVFRDYDRYWKHSDPSFCKILVPAA